MSSISNNSDFKQDKKEANKTEKNGKLEKCENLATNLLFSVMLGITVIGSTILLYQATEFTNYLKQYNLEYEFPAISDFKITAIASLVLIVSIYLIKYI